MKFKVSAILPTPADVYFMERDSSAFRSLVARMSNLESLEMGKSWHEGDAEVYEFITKPDIEKYVPKQFKHFIPGGDLHYTDVITYDPKEISCSPYRMAVTSIPPIFSGKASIKSTLTIEAVTPETCRQTLEGEIHIKILGLGAIAEKIIVDNLKNVYKHVPGIVERWVAFRDEVIKNGGSKDVLVSGRPENIGVPWINENIKRLLKEDISESESSSETSSQHPSIQTESSMDGIGSESISEHASAQNSEEEEDEDVFFDARDQTSWLDMRDLVLESHGKDPKLERQLQKDTETTHQLLTNYQAGGKTLKAIHIGNEPPASNSKHTEGLRPEVSVASRRFSSTAQYNTELAEWRQFWQDHEVPQRKQHARLGARLGNLFRIGADAGLIRPKKEKKHLVPWLHRNKHKKSHSGDQELTNASNPQHLQIKDGSQDSGQDGRDLHHSKSLGNSNDGNVKTHVRRKSGPVKLGLFTRVSYEDP